MFEQRGVESKCFYFAGAPENASLREEGGSIEVQVFRAKGRRRCAPRLERYSDLHEQGVL